jgi:putative alpha-1,2-mannosidase
MKAPLASVDNKYIQSVTLNGQKLDRTYITHQEIMDGGTLEFTMGAVANKELFK